MDIQERYSADRWTWVRQDLPTLIARSKAGLGPTYLCLEHGVTYTSEQLMCPNCEQEICETHDKESTSGD